MKTSQAKSKADVIYV